MHIHSLLNCLKAAIPVVPEDGAAIETSTAGLRWDPAIVTVAVALPRRKDGGTGGKSWREGGRKILKDGEEGRGGNLLLRVLLMACGDPGSHRRKVVAHQHIRVHTRCVRSHRDGLGVSLSLSRYPHGPRPDGLATTHWLDLKGG